MEKAQVKDLVESLIFASDRPITPAIIRAIIGNKELEGRL